ncbi:MAG: DnaJ domain-containing protein [Candidatus Sumerlaeia bacterium]|nr:DnaJ domain-containing protein [Candidatus Sumerlaeia bacterium]
MRPRNTHLSHLRLLFVSQDDLCRGPLAREIAQGIVAQQHVVGMNFDSAGLRAPVAQPPPEEVVHLAQLDHLNLAYHRSRPLTPELLANYDAALCMTVSIAERIRKGYPKEQGEKAVVLSKAAQVGWQTDDIPSLVEIDGGWRTLVSQLRAAVGRLIRGVEGSLRPLDELGVGKPIAIEVAGPPPGLSPLGLAVWSVLNGAQGPMRTADIVERLARMRHKTDAMAVSRLFQGELKRAVRADGQGGWSLAGGARPSAAAPPPAAPPRDEPRPSRPVPPTAAPPPPPPPPQPEAFVVLSVTQAMVILGLPPKSDPDEVRRAYRDLMKRYHPDRFVDDPDFRQMAEEKARRINAAWEFMKPRLDG